MIMIIIIIIIVIIIIDDDLCQEMISMHFVFFFVQFMSFNDDNFCTNFFVKITKMISIYISQVLLIFFSYCEILYL